MGGPRMPARRLLGLSQLLIERARLLAGLAPAVAIADLARIVADAAALRRHNGDRRADQRDPEVTRTIAEATRPVLLNAGDLRVGMISMTTVTGDYVNDSLPSGIDPAPATLAEHAGNLVPG